ncbi:hypothetical protein EON83_30075 [bacterium]|nr:MAG: hypothetical protein EON83_30075 [bacterium]
MTNVLFDWDIMLGGPTPASTWYPGNEYVDFISGDFYDGSAAPAGMSSIEGPFMNLLINTRQRPTHFAEMGYNPGAATTTNIWTTKTGSYHRDRISRSSFFAPWRSPHGPAVGDATQADFAAMIEESSCVTRDRLTGVYS